jgi:transcriptional regulator with XRE-family HTH domain
LSSFGNRFKKLRINKKMTQDELAEDFNNKFDYSFTKATISQYENDRRIPEVSALLKFTDYFNVSLDYLLCNDIFTIKELESSYNIKNDQGAIDIEEIFSILMNLNKNNKILLANKELNNEQKILLSNSIDVICELLKKT